MIKIGFNFEITDMVFLAAILHQRLSKLRQIFTILF